MPFDLPMWITFLIMVGCVMASRALCDLIRHYTRKGR